MALTTEDPAESDYLILNDVISSQLWREAIVQYNEKWNFDIDSLPKVQNLDEVLSVIKSSESSFSLHRHNGNKLDKIRSMISKNLKPVERIIQAISFAAGKAFAPAETIFGAVKVLTAAAQDVSDGFDQISEGFQLMQSYFSQLSILKDKKITTELRNAVLMVFISTVEMLLKSSEQIKKGRFNRFAKSVFLGECDDLKSIIRSYKHCIEQQRIVIENTSYNIINEIKHELTAQSNEKGLEELSKWLTELDFQETHESISRKRHEGTCHWLFQHDRFRAWYAGGTERIFWCKGKAGSGKSVITSAVAEYIEVAARSNTTEEAIGSSKVATTYFYCDSQNMKTHSETELLSVVIKTLVEKDESAAREVYLFRKKTGRRPCKDDLLTLIQTCSKYFDRIFVLIDALDECQKDSMNKLMALMKQLEPLVRLFVTSRPHIEIKSNIRASVALIGIDKANKLDIKSYLRSVIDEDEDFSDVIDCEPQARKEIINTIADGVDGMFLLAYYQINDVCGQITLKDVYSCLKSLNTNINQYYERNIKRIEQLPDRVARMVKKAIAYIHYARRPLNIYELCHALSVDDSDTGIDLSKIPAATILRKNSTGLIDFGDNGTLGLVHLTLNEYLDRYPERLGAKPKVELAKTCLVYLSFEIFSTGPCKDNDSLKKRLQEYSFLDYAAHNLGFHLKMVPGYQDEECFQSIYEYFKNSNKRSSLCQVLFLTKYWTTRSYDNFSPAFDPSNVAVYFGLHELLPRIYCGCTRLNCDHFYQMIRVAVKQGHNMCFAYLYDLRPLPIEFIECLFPKVVEMGHYQMVKMLLHLKFCRGGLEIKVAMKKALEKADVKIILLILKTCEENECYSFVDYEALIDCLAASASSGTIQLLLDKYTGNKPSLENSLMRYAMIEGNREVRELLVQNGVRLASWKEIQESNTVISGRAFCDFQLVSHLLQNGMDTNVKARDIEIFYEYESGLQMAAYYEQEEVVQLLLDEGADPNITYGERALTPLYYAAAMGQKRIVERLLYSGADPNITDGRGWMTPLYVAAMKEHSSVVQVLIDRTRSGKEIVERVLALKGEQGSLYHFLTAEVDANILKPGQYKIHAASSAAYGQGQDLLEAGADINADLGGGQTALHQAARFRNIDTIEFLLANGAVVNRRDWLTLTALFNACSRGFHEAVEILLKSGADPDIQSLGQTTLSYAAKDKKFDLVELLAEWGANINAEDYHGQRAVHWCARYGTQENLESLIKRGAHVNAKDYWGQTPIMWLVFRSEYPRETYRSVSRPKLDMLLRYHADINATSRDGCTALHLAISMCSKDVLCYLLGIKEASVDIRAKGNFRPIDIAVMTGNISKVKLLLEKGAELMAGNHQCSIVFEYEFDYSSYLGDRTSWWYSSTSTSNNLINYLCTKLLEWQRNDLGAKEVGDVTTLEQEDVGVAPVCPDEELEAEHVVQDLNDDEEGDDTSNHLEFPNTWEACNLKNRFKDEELKTEYTVLDLAIFSGNKKMRRLVEDDLAKSKEMAGSESLAVGLCKEGENLDGYIDKDVASS